MRYIVALISLLILISGCSNENSEINAAEWRASPTFHIPVTFGDGTKGEYILVGEEGRIGFLTGGLPMVTGKPNKYMWHLWGDTLDDTQQLFGKNIEIRGLSKETGEEILVFTGSTGIPNPNIPDNNHVARMPSSMSLPYAGLWRLDAYLEDELFGSIVVQVQKEV
ncbi:hypothetical protein AB6A23_14045 [Paenibacillus tarimensis]